MRAVSRALLLTVLAGSAIGAAGDPSPPQAPVPQAPAPQAPAPQAAPTGDMKDFVPTQKVRAEDAVAFPTDI